MVHQPVSFVSWFNLARRPLAPAATRRGWPLTAAVACSLVTTTAYAHIELVEPLARYEVTGVDTGIKGCPCGLATGGGNSNRTCKVELDGSDPNRDESRALTVPAGSTLTLQFDETIGHAGKYRVAFDPEGADFFDFNEHVLTEVDDPQGNTGNAGGMRWEIDVTLPETPCTNCTLQLIQVMEPSTLGGTVDGTQLANMSTYYTCIDLVLTDEVSGTGETSAETTSGVGGSSESVTSETGADTSEIGSSTLPGGASTSAPTASSVTSAPPVTASVTTGLAGSSSSVAPPAVTPSSPAPTSAAPAPSSAASTSSDFTPAAGDADASGCAVSRPQRGREAHFAGWLSAFALVLVARRWPCRSAQKLG